MHPSRIKAPKPRRERPATLIAIDGKAATRLSAKKWARGCKSISRTRPHNIGKRVRDSFLQKRPSSSFCVHLYLLLWRCAAFLSRRAWNRRESQQAFFRSSPLKVPRSSLRSRCFFSGKVTLIIREREYVVISHV